MSKSWNNLWNAETGVVSKKIRNASAKKAKKRYIPKKDKRVESYGYERMHVKNQMIGVE